MPKPKPTRSRTNRTAGNLEAVDRHALYELAVQAPEQDAQLLASWFRREAGRPLAVSVRQQE